ncbi:uncharacterized protein LOC111242808 [Varroa destructor]|uniref:Uncharacterized protein n=1 Tax=Varroa destructor TaxID=109461 RepID=A0A7M7IW87_VARDE|nr:uncharacterized protein LOC111242808 [Varroa destructor]
MSIYQSDATTQEHERHSSTWPAWLPACGYSYCCLLVGTELWLFAKRPSASAWIPQEQSFDSAFERRLSPKTPAVIHKMHSAWVPVETLTLAVHPSSGEKHQKPTSASAPPDDEFTSLPRVTTSRDTVRQMRDRISAAIVTRHSPTMQLHLPLWPSRILATAYRRDYDYYLRW